MTGTLPSMGLVQQLDINGRPLSGCQLFLYEANSSTIVDSFRDFALSPGAKHPWPILADAYGRLPMFFLPDGFYRARLDDRHGKPIFDEPMLPTTGAGSGGDTIVEGETWKTGDFLWTPTKADKGADWVRSNGLSIGGPTSNANGRASDACNALFNFLWTHFDNILAPMYSKTGAAVGRGASAAADWAAERAIGTVMMSGLLPGALDGMGRGSSSQRFRTAEGEQYGHVLAYVNTAPAATSAAVNEYDVAGSIVGENTHKLTVNELPSHAHGSTLNEGVGHQHYYYRGHYYSAGVAGIVTPNVALIYEEAQELTDPPMPTYANVTIHNYGGGHSFGNMPYVMLGAWWVRL